jgi:acyl-coenzyme A synthetase/AMP-(fatty) acid ligase
MIYTSGTTGRPKGVVHSQQQVRSHALYMAHQEYAMSADDTWLHMAPMCHAMDLFAVYSMVAVGGTQVRSVFCTCNKGIGCILGVVYV